MQEKHAEEEKNLRLQQAELMALFAELDPDPVFRLNDDGIITLANRSAIELFPGKPITGTKVIELLPPVEKINLQKCIENSEKHNFIVSLGNKIFNFVLTGIPKYKICQIYGSDITKLKLAEEKIQEALTATENSEKLKTFFLLQMSHEIRSPLMAILGFSESIYEDMKDKIPQDLEYAFNAIQNSGKRLYRTIDLNLNMSQLLTGNYKTNFVNVSLTEVFQKLITDYRKIAKEKNLQFIYEDLSGGETIVTDIYSVNLIIQNLLDNAVKYTLSGSVSVKIYFNDRNELAIDVTDTGIGISPDYFDNLYKPFTQEVMGYNRPYEGNGLGLAIVKNVAEIINAEISVRSEKNKGSVFTVTFKK